MRFMQIMPIESSFSVRMTKLRKRVSNLARCANSVPVNLPERFSRTVQPIGIAACRNSNPKVDVIETQLASSSAWPSSSLFRFR